MTFLKLLQSLEEFIYEMALWIILIPKTLLKVIFRPSWIRDYVATEWEKEPAERFSTYLSPILSWIFIVVIPHTIFLHHLSSKPPRIQNMLNGLPAMLDGLTIEPKITIAALSALGFPLLYSYLIQKARKESTNRLTLKRLFYTQCLCCAPAQLSTTLFRFAALDKLSEKPLPGWMFITTLIIFGCSQIWLVYAETQIIREEVALHWFKALGLAVIPVIPMILFVVSIVCIAVAVKPDDIGIILNCCLTLAVA